MPVNNLAVVETNPVYMLLSSLLKQFYQQT